MGTRRSKLTWLQTNDRQQIQTRLLNLERFDGATYLTLTRTANQNITTAGTTINWQRAEENVGEWTWAGAAITVPMAGYYQLNVNGNMSAKDTVHADITVDGIYVATMGTGDSKNTLFRFNLTRFFKAGDVVRVVMYTSTATHAITVDTEDSANESPMLHMVQL